MHSSLTVDGIVILMASDDMHPKALPGPHVKPPQPPCTISINFNDEVTIDRVYSVLSEGGDIKCPLANAFWGAKFAMFFDKYGISWMLNCDNKPKPKTEESKEEDKDKEQEQGQEQGSPKKARKE